MAFVKANLPHSVVVDVVNCFVVAVVVLDGIVGPHNLLLHLKFF
jgi:hypothetical protein